MATNVQQLPLSRPAAAPPATTALLEASGKLGAARDRNALVNAASALLCQLAPGTRIERAARPAAAPAAARSHGRRLEIALSDAETLIIDPPRSHRCGRLLETATGLIEARVRALSEQTEMAELAQQLGRSERLQHALYAIADQASTAGTDLTQMFAALHAIVGSLMYAENFYIALYDADEDSVWFPYFADSMDPEPYFSSPGKQTPEVASGRTWSMNEIDHGPTWYLIHDGKPLMGPLESIRQQVSGPFKSSGAAPKDWLGVPLLRNEEVVGCVVVQSYEEAYHYDEQDKTLLVYVAQHMQTALEWRLARAELERRVAERTSALSEANRVLKQEVLERQHGERLQAALFQIAELASTTDRIDDFYASVHRVVGDLLNARNFYIALVSEDGSELTFPYSVDERDDERAPRKLGKGLTEYVLQHGTALLADESEIARLRASGEATQHGTGSVCWLGVPLVCADRTAGVLVVQTYSREYHYTPRDQELLTFVSYHIANALERIRARESLKRAYAQLEDRVAKRTRALALANHDLRSQITERERVEARLKYETLHDSLTGLPNRILLMQRLERSLVRYHEEPARRFAVLFMDLDRFKVINDSEGHLIGDDLLLHVGARVRACLKSEDVVARLGGDEFGVLLEGIPDTSCACQIAERIINDLNVPFRLAAKELFTSTSIGVALAAPHYQNADELLRDADSAMYRAKADGRHRYAVFDDELRREVVTLLEVENDLRRGLTREEFVPYYQPIVDLENGDVVGYEALMRWRHPQRGVLLPGAFLNIAEDTGTAETIDWKIYTQVCRDINALAGNRDIFVAINLSARHFNNPNFAQRLLGLLAEYGVAPTRLRVEVTEHALLENTATVKRVLKTFRHAGISISLDDFGTGYSSLSYLHQYPLQTLKIDRSFVANLTEDTESNSGALIRAIIAMAETLSMQVIAEGVETGAQRDLLQSLGCRQVQGFLYAKARPADAWIGGALPTPAG